LHGEIVRVLLQNIKMLLGVEMQNNGSKMLKKLAHQLVKIQSLGLLLFMMVQDTHHTTDMSVLSWK